MRVQRGKPQGRCTVNCYLHPRCSLLLNLNRTPSDAELYKWLYAVPAAPPGAPREEVKELARQHMNVGKAKWSAPLKRAAS